jgi:hypothetical protein
MASVNKESLREEFGALKERFTKLSADGKITAESRALIEALLMLLQLLMAVFMEKNTPKSSVNSSKPSSQTPKDDTALSHSGTHGKGKQLTETRCANTRTVVSVEVSPVNFCEQCGEDLHKSKASNDAPRSTSSSRRSSRTSMPRSSPARIAVPRPGAPSPRRSLARCSTGRASKRMP